MSFAVAESSTEETSTTTGANAAATTAVGKSAKSAATRDENANSANSNSGSSDAVEETTTTTTPPTTTTNHNDDVKLNAAYEALEKMRQLNLEVTCSELGIHYDASRHADQCTACLLANGNKNTTRRRRHRFSRSSQPPPTSQRNNDKNSNNDKDAAAPGRFSRLSKLVPHQRSNQTASSAKAKATATKTQHHQCLICGSPACRKHSSRTFRQESNNLTVCLDCEKLFDLDFVVDCLLETNTAARRARIQHLLDSYDRALVMLRFSRQFIEPTAASLEESTELQNKVGLGSSGVGLASGVLGIAAAATILTPAGPPLLIASLLFGGSATAVQTGTEVALNHWSEPNKLADRIIALNGVRLSILRIVAILRDAMLLDHIRSDQYNGKNSIYSSSTNETTATTTTSSTSTADANKTNNQQQLLNSTASRGTMLGSLTVGRFSMAGTEVAQTGTLAGRNARFFSRTGSNLMRTARLARFAGGALSAAIVVLEARSMKHTIQNLQNGNPCQKAETLRAIHQELLSSESDGADSSIVETETLDRECERYLQTMDARQRAMTEEEVSQLLVEQSEKAFAEAAAAQQEQWQQQQQLVVVGEETETLSSSPWTGADGTPGAGEQQQPPPHHDDDDDDDDNNTTNEQPSDTDLQQEHSFSIILDGLVEEADGDDDEHHDSDTVTCSSHASNSTTLSLLARIELHKQKEAAVAHPSSTNVAGSTASAAASGATTATPTSNTAAATSAPLDQTGVATASTASSMASPGLEE